MNSVVSDVAHKINKRYVGTRQEILVEGRSDRHPERLMGRTRTNKIVNFEGTESMVGQLVDVEIVTANPWAMRGKLPE
jgi:tRNA-2-methylthio-N6-dimethylallyladenosine synthase